MDQGEPSYSELYRFSSPKKEKCTLILADVIFSTIQEFSILLMCLVTAMFLRKKKKGDFEGKKRSDFENVIGNLKTYLALVFILPAITTGVSFCQWLSKL